MNGEEKTRKCPNCSAVVGENERKCPKCGQHVALSSFGVSEKLPNCPVCKIPIYPAVMAGFEIYHCAECEATVIKKETLMKIQPTDPKAIQISDLERGHVRPPYFEPRDKPPFLICPYCMKKMLEKKLGPMTADVCEKCGAVFFERGKEKHINEMLGPYKMQALKRHDSSSRRSRRR